MAQESEGSDKIASQIVQPDLPPAPPNVGIAIGFQTGPIPPQVLDKISSEHIAQILGFQDNQSKRQHELAIAQLDYRERDRDKQRQVRRKGERNTLIFGAVILVFIVVICVVCFYFQQPDIVKFLVSGILGFAGGFLTGKGYERGLD
jgi:hypothetical protein